MKHVTATIVILQKQFYKPQGPTLLVYTAA